MYEQMIHCDIILVLLQIQRAFRAGNRTKDPWDGTRPRPFLVPKSRNSRTRTERSELGPGKIRNQGAS